MNNYPEGADNAPYNKTISESKEIEVLISLVLSKSFKIKVADDKIDNSNLKDAVQKQICLPQEAYKHCLTQTKLYKDLENWNVDDFQIILE